MVMGSEWRLAGSRVLECPLSNNRHQSWGPRQVLFPNTDLPDSRLGVIAIPAGVASSGLHIYRLFLAGDPQLQGTALLLMQ